MVCKIGNDIGLNILAIIFHSPVLAALRSLAMILSTGDLSTKRICPKALAEAKASAPLSLEPREGPEPPKRCPEPESKEVKACVKEVASRTLWRDIPLTNLVEEENIQTGLRSFRAAYENKQSKRPANKVRLLSDGDLLMILLALFGLAKHRRHWGRKPEETWGVFLELLDDILATKATRPVTVLQENEWNSLSRWCASFTAAQISSMISAAVNFHTSPNPTSTMRLAQAMGTR
mmetsp:Transcript_9235/g.22175  ORF Transcript_9235/g.22175 Transcript_9235/m.22175 type:complete len:234 (-) Transcript_9235:49-750(-)